MLRKLGRPRDARTAFDEVVDRFGDNLEGDLGKQYGIAQSNRYFRD
jgi:hypothetical protein